jgi:hypothetical protein
VGGACVLTAWWLFKPYLSIASIISISMGNEFCS